MQQPFQADLKAAAESWLAVDNAIIHCDEEFGEVGLVGVAFVVLGAHDGDDDFVLWICPQHRAGGGAMAEGLSAEQRFICGNAVLACSGVAFVEIGQAHSPGDVEFRVWPEGT